MKKLLLTLPLAATVMLAVATSAFAQGDQPKRAGGAGGAPRMDAAERLKMMSEKLGLNEEQKGKVKDILAKSAEKAKAAREDKTGTPEERRAKMQESRKSEMEEIRAVLTPEQQEKLKELRPAGRGGKAAEAK